MEQKKNKHPFFVGLLAPWLMLGCSSADMKSAEKLAKYNPSNTTQALQFVPAVEDEYPRQEASFQGTGVHYRLAKAMDVKGTIQTTAGDLVAGRVKFSGAVQGGVSLDPVSVRGKEFDSKDGKFLLKLVQGDYGVDLIPGASFLPAQRQFVKVDEANRTLNFVLSPGAVYSGLVSDGAGQPMPGVSIRAISNNGNLSSALSTTGADGRYSLAVGPNQQETHKLEFSAPENKTLPSVVFAGLPATHDATLNVQFLPLTLANITGKVLVDATGDAAIDVPVVFSAVKGPPILAARRGDTLAANSDGQAVFQTRTQGDGSFSITLPLGAWTYTMTIQPPLDRVYGGYYTPAFSPPGESVIRLPSKRAIKGKVTDPSGDPVVRAEIVIAKTVSLTESQQVQRVYTGADGHFTALLDASAQAYDVTIVPAPVSVAGHAGEFLGRCVRSGVGVGSFKETFIVSLGSLVEGYVEDMNGDPISRVSVSLVQTGGGQTEALRLMAESSAPTDDNGLFRFVMPKADLPAGCRGTGD